MEKQDFINTEEEDLFSSTYNIEGVYGIISMSNKQTKNGGFLTTYVVRNKDGYMNAVNFNRDIVHKEGDLVHISGFKDYYEGNYQIKIQHIKKVKHPENYIELVLPTSQYDIESIKKEVFDIIKNIQNKELLIFANTLLESCPNFFVATAAKRFHHAWIGGLAEHSLQVAKIALSCADIYCCNKDIVIIGALFHDIGKIEEIEMNSVFKYSDKGQLTGHSYIGASLIREHSKKFPVDDNILTEIEHVILSHHGDAQYGASVKPVTKEAILIHLADQLDAGMVKVREFIKFDQSSGNWTFYNQDTGRSYKKK